MDGRIRITAWAVIVTAALGWSVALGQDAGEPTVPAFDLEEFDRLIRPWPTREAYERFVTLVEDIAARLPH